jgi:hypothetical protein
MAHPPPPRRMASLMYVRHKIVSDNAPTLMAGSKSSPSLPITSDDGQLTTGSGGSGRRSGKAAGFIVVAAVVASLALIGAAAIHGYKHASARSRRSARPFASRQLQLQQQNATRNSSLPTGQLLDDGEINAAGIASTSNEYYEINLRDSGSDSSPNNPVGGAADAVVARQDAFATDERLILSFANAVDVEAGDWIAIVPATIDLGNNGIMSLLGGNDYLAYAYVCDPGADPIDCPRHGSVAWEARFLPPGRYMAYLAKEDYPEPFTVKAATPSPFAIGTDLADCVEIVEAVPPTPVSLVPTSAPVVPTPVPSAASQKEEIETSPPPTQVQTASLDTSWDGGIRNNGITFMIQAKEDIHVTGIDIHTPLRQLIPVSVYTTVGTLVGKERDASKWNKIASTKVMGAGDNTPTPISISTSIEAGQKISFYIDTPSTFKPGPVRYSPSIIPTGGVYAYDDNISILVGTGNDAFFGNSYPNRIFNGAVRYEKLPNGSTRNSVGTSDDTGTLLDCG